MNLRNNPDGTCNCRPIMPGTCFFTDGLGGRCDCKCHNPMKNQEKCSECQFEEAHAQTCSKYAFTLQPGKCSPECNPPVHIHYPPTTQPDKCEKCGGAGKGKNGIDFSCSCECHKPKSWSETMTNEQLAIADEVMNGGRH